MGSARWAAIGVCLAGCFTSNRASLETDDGSEDASPATRVVANGGSSGTGSAGAPSTPRVDEAGAGAGEPTAGSNAAGVGAAGADGAQAGTGGSPAPCLPGEFCVVPGPECGSLRIDPVALPVRVPEHLVLVYDRSASMIEPWGSTTRWQATAAAVRRALDSAVDVYDVAAVFFPSSDPDGVLACVDPTGAACLVNPVLQQPAGTCRVNPVDSRDQFGFGPVPEFLAAMGTDTAAPLYAPIPQGLTPLGDALSQADAALMRASATETSTIVVLTDGEPDCAWDRTPAFERAQGWADAGAPTYVITLPGTADTTELEALAAAGGTEPAPVSDVTALEHLLGKIFAGRFPLRYLQCSVELQLAPDPPEELHVVVTESGVDFDVPRDAGGDAGWSVDGAVVELHGGLCADAMAGRFTDIRFEFACVDLPPLPPY